MPNFYTGKRRDEGAKRGTATHTVMQFCNFRGLRERGVDEEIGRLVREGYLTEKDAALVHRDEIATFARSPLAKRLTEAKKLHRELRFHAKLPATLFTEDEEKRARYRDREVLVQGVIDCIIEEEDGSLILIDYKTDRLSLAERKNPALAAEVLRAAHKSQLSYYALAVEQMFGVPPRQTLVYSLHLGDTVEI